MQNALFIAIAVHKAQGLPVLDGVIKGVDDMTSWARAQGYDVIQVDDQENEVDIARLRQALTPSENGKPSPQLLLDRPRIVVYFCGHGLYAPQDQYWILSSGPNQPTERISAVGFRDTLATYGATQIAFFSDACRTPLAVIGQGDCVVRAWEGEVKPPQKDVFFSSRAGDASFAVPAQDGKPAFCVFSQMLHKALTQEDGDNLDKLYLRNGEKVVTSQSLADYLPAKVAELALHAGQRQWPQCDAGFLPFRNSYTTFPKLEATLRKPSRQWAGRPVGDSADSDGGALLSIDVDDLYFRDSPNFDFEQFEQYSAEVGRKGQEERLDRSRSEWRSPFISRIQAELARLGETQWPLRGPGPTLVVSHQPSELIGPSGVAKISNVWDDPLPLRPNTKGFWFRNTSSFLASKHSQVLIVESGDRYAPIPIFNDLWCAAVFDQPVGGQGAPGARGGLDLLAWGAQGNPGSDPKLLQVSEALKGLSAGTLTSNDLGVLLGQLRYQKHTDPMLGVLAAYLYNNIGDIDNIRRMCFFYVRNAQDVPFDIAMLADVPLEPHLGRFRIRVPAVPEASRARRIEGAPDFTWQETAEVRAEVAGVTPLLRAGWQSIRRSSYRIHQICWELVGSMTEAPISTFSGKTEGARLIAAFKEQNAHAHRLHPRHQ